MILAKWPIIMDAALTATAVCLNPAVNTTSAESSATIASFTSGVHFWQHFDSDELRMWAFLSETYFFSLHVVVAMVIVPVLTGYLIQTFLVSWLQVEADERERRVARRRGAGTRRAECASDLRSCARGLRACCGKRGAEDVAAAARTASAAYGDGANENLYTLHMRERMGDFNFALFGGHLEQKNAQEQVAGANSGFASPRAAQREGEGGERSVPMGVPMGGRDGGDGVGTHTTIGDSGRGGGGGGAVDLRRALARAHAALRRNGLDIPPGDAAIVQRPTAHGLAPPALQRARRASFGHSRVSSRSLIAIQHRPFQQMAQNAVLFSGDASDLSHLNGERASALSFADVTAS